MIDLPSELPASWQTVLTEILGSPLAWVRLPILEPTAAAMTAAGWLERWDLEISPVWTLTPAAADRLHVVLVEHGPAELPRWHDATRPLPPLVQPPDPNLHGQPSGRDLFALTGVDARPATPREIREWKSHKQRNTRMPTARSAQD